jgi:hypothetical protein
MGFKVCYSWVEFLDICHQYKFTSKINYLERYKIDPMLPSNPNLHYKEWISWKNICIKEENIRKYRRYVKSKKDYREIPEKWKKPPHAPYKNFYSFKEFLKVCKRLKVTSQKDYLEKRKSDPRLPCNPNRYYKEWTYKRFYNFL